MKRIFILFMLLCINIAMWAIEPSKDGNKITGHIIVEGLEEGVPYATVRIIAFNDGPVPDKIGVAGTVSNEEGYFVFKNLPSGDYTLEVTAIGFKNQTKTVSVKSSYNTDLHFEMQEDVYLADEVVISANRNEVRRKDAPVVVNVMSAKLFETVNSTDLAKSLNFQSGLRVENNCQNCGFSQVRINGLEGPYSQILINSRPVMSALSGVYGLEQIPVNMIERVEVVRGGGSALFGANAVGGTINIITKDPVSNSFQVATTMSNHDAKSWEQNVSGNVSLVSKDNSYGIAMYENYRNRNPYDHDGDSFSEMGKLNLNTFGMRAYYRPNNNSRLNLEYHTTNEFRRGGNKFDLEPHETDITEQTKHVINSGGVSYDQYWREAKHKVSIYGSIQHTDRNSYYGTDKDPNAYGKTKDLTWVAGAMYVGNMKKCLWAPAVFTGGVEYQDNELDDQNHYRGTLKQHVRVWGTFAQNEWHMKYFTMLIGLRMDHHNMVDKMIFSPRVNLLYKPMDELQARLTYSTGFRAPQAYDEDLHVNQVGGENITIRQAAGLKPEHSNSFSGSVDWTFNFGHWQGNILLEGFYTGLNDVFTLVDVGEDAEGNFYQERRNAHKAMVYGGNIDAKIAHGREAQLQLGFTVQRSRYSKDVVWRDADSDAGLEALTTRDLPRTPNYYGYFTFTSAPTKFFDFSLSGTYTGRMYVPHFSPGLNKETADEYQYKYIDKDVMVHTPDFFDLNLKINYTFVLNDHLKLQLNAGVQNIFNSFQKDLDQGMYRDSGYCYGPSLPRTYFFGVKFTS